MSKFQMYAAEAERLYIHEHMTIAEIASRLNLAERTVWTWKEKGKWDERREQYLVEKRFFHEELYLFASKLLNQINRDLDADKKIDAGRLYALTRLIPNLTKAKDFDDIIQEKNSSERVKPLSIDDILALVNKKLTGIDE